MTLQVSEILSLNSQEAWKWLREQLWNHFSAPLPVKGCDKEIVRRDRAVAELDNLLAASAWNLWNAFADALPRGSNSVIDFWNATSTGPNGKAVLILDGLSLREIPFLLAEAEKRQFHLLRSGAWTAEMPGTTTSYANALGFPGRSALSNNKTASKPILHKHCPNAWTESCDLPFLDCAEMLPPKPMVFFWHHWPDVKMHDATLETLAKDAGEKLTSDDFWTFIDRLTTGRTLLITSDHGYAATGHFHDLQDKNQIETMRVAFAAQRHAKADNAEPLPWIPPLDLTLGQHRYVLGRHKWKIQGGYPALQHGGLSLLEMFVPFIEIQR